MVERIINIIVISSLPAQRSRISSVQTGTHLVSSTMTHIRSAKRGLKRGLKTRSAKRKCVHLRTVDNTCYAFAYIFLCIITIMCMHWHVLLCVWVRPWCDDPEGKILKTCIDFNAADVGAGYL